MLVLKNPVDISYLTKYAGFSILIIQPQNIPPHIAVLYKGRYYALGKMYRKHSIEDIWSFIIKKKIIIAELNCSDTEASDIFFYYDNFCNTHNLQQGTVSCLTPILYSLETVLGINIKYIHYIFELLPYLETMGYIRQYLTMNVQHSILVHRYSWNAINTSIQQHT